MSSQDQTTRHKILQACAALLSDGDGKGVRMGDIAKAANISRQAVYLHFASRADLLEATTHFIDEQLGLDARLAPSRQAPSGRERLLAYIAMWGAYVPHIYPTAKALIAASDTDPAAAGAWQERMAAMREGCEAAVRMLHDEGRLAPPWTVDSATDLLWTLLAVPNWQQLTRTCGWDQATYIGRLQDVAARTLIRTDD